MSIPENTTAHALARQLASPLEAISNIHYLIDQHLESPEDLRRLREMEEVAYEMMIDILRPHWTPPPA